MSKEIYHIHNNLFQKTLFYRSTAWSVLDGYFPGITQYMSARQMNMQNLTHIDKGLVGFHKDVLYRTKLKDRDCFVFFHLEHQSSDCHMMAQRFENYRAGVLAQYVANYSRAKTLPVVLPILLAHQKGGWKAPLSYMELINLPNHLKELLSPHIPNFEYLLIDLSKIPDDQIKGDAAARMTQQLFKAQMHGSLDYFPDFEGFLEQAFQEKAATSLLNEFIVYMTSAGFDIDPNQFAHKMKSLSNLKLKGQAMTLIEQWIEQGREEGLEKGLEQGREESKTLIEQGLEQGREESKTLIEQGCEKGESIGRIMTYQELMGRNDYSRKLLESKSLKSLKAILAELKGQYRA